MEGENEELKQMLAEAERKCEVLEKRLRTGEGSGVTCGVLEEENVFENDDCIDGSDETGSGKDSFERMSSKSFMSCGNFLMLALVAVCCICGFIEPTTNEGFTRGFYDMNNIKIIMQKQNSEDCH